MNTLSKVAILLIVVVSLGFGQAAVSGNVVRFTDSSGNLITAGDNANDALRVNVVAGSAGGASHVDDAVFTLTTDDIAPTGGIFDDVGPTACTEGDACVARITSDRRLHVSVENSPTVTVGTFPDNEPFDVAQYGGSAVGAGNAFHVQPGTAAVFSVDDNSTTLSVDDGAGALTVDGTVAATQSGTYTVQPGNTPNTTAWIVETISYNSCGMTLQDTPVTDVATGAGTTLETVTTCVESFHVTNVTATPCTITIEDRNATPKEYVEAFSVPGNSTVRWDMDGRSFDTGITAIAGTATCLNISMIGVQ